MAYKHCLHNKDILYNCYMLLNLPDLPLVHICSYLDNEDCCKPSSLGKLSFGNKQLAAFARTQCKFKRRRILRCTNILGIRWKKTVICFKCSIFNDKEQDVLASIITMCREIKKGTLMHFYIDPNKRKNRYSNFVHFTTKDELTNFISKIYHYIDNIHFSSTRCCSGVGCEYNIGY